MDEEEDDDIFKENSKKGRKDKKKESKSIFADYDEFAHLLEGDLYDGDSKSKKKHKFGDSAGNPGYKRSFSQRGGANKRDGHGSGKRARRN